MNYKFVDCGTHFWFIKTEKKYHHCLSPYDMEHHKIRIGHALPSGVKKTHLDNLHTWLRLSDEGKIELDCYLNNMSKREIKNQIAYMKLPWKRQTKPAKEIIKQLRSLL
tara:strand:- start:406 stop:732 length:327 start_codon:yes stop_codon:yes gene_type:complete